jgi:hypothetical protein
MMFVFLQNTEEKKEPDLKNATHGHEHTKCKYFKKDEIPTQKQNKQLIEILKKVLK